MMLGDVDPYERLGDTRPARYNIESDDEDEVDPGLQPRQTQPHQEDIKVILADQDKYKDRNLIVARGKAGRIWVKGIARQLGEQLGGVFVDHHQVGMLFSLSDDGGTMVLVTELTSSLPIWVQQRYVNTVVTALAPLNVMVLDSYSPASYSANERISLDDAPTRYLGFGKPPDEIATKRIQLYAPPNVVSSTSGAFLSTLYLRSLSNPSLGAVCYLILLPSLSTFKPAHQVEPMDTVALVGGGEEDAEEWSSEQIQDVDVVIRGSKAGELWEPTKGVRVSGGVGKGKPVDRVDGMYI